MQLIGQLTFELMNIKAAVINKLLHLQKTLKHNNNEINTQMSLVYMKAE